VTSARIVDPAKSGLECRDRAVAALCAQDWHAAYEWAKSWIMRGGGAWIAEPWLVYAASAVLHGQPRTAVHSIDLALSHWIADPADRAVLRWVRGCVIRVHLHDPRTALVDFEAAHEAAPEWLVERVAEVARKCRDEAAASRKRKPAVANAPEQLKPSTAPVAPQVVWIAPGSVPSVWDAVSAHIPSING